MINEALDQIRVVRLELHEELMKIPQYRALTALDEIVRIIEKAAIADNTVVPVTYTAPGSIDSPTPFGWDAPAPAPVTTPAPPTPKQETVKKASKPLSQVQALLQVLRKKDGPASIGWLLAELELLGVGVGGVSPRKTLGVALSGNKDLFRRVEYDGGRWLWGLADRKYVGETTYDHLPATEFKSMRVSKK